MRVVRIACGIVLMATVATTATAQCKSFTKRKCIPALRPYVHNGQFNSTTLFAGESATVMQTFYSGMDYRLDVCFSKPLDGVYYEVKDTDGNPIYSSKGKDSQQWDFRMGGTQQLLVEVTVPEQTSYTEVEPSGCVAVLIGFTE